jgi:hypothetical protein
MTWQYNPERGDITDPDLVELEPGCYMMAFDTPDGLCRPKTGCPGCAQARRRAYYGGVLICETVPKEHAPLLVNAPAMLVSLKALLARIESGYLVRNTEKDSSPDFHMEALVFVCELKQAAELIEKIEPKKEVQP